MNGTDTFFYTWLQQLGELAKLNDQVQVLRTRLETQEDILEDDNENALSKTEIQEEVKEKLAEIDQIKKAAAENKKHLIHEVRAAKDQSIIINPKETSGGRTPSSYHLFLKGDELQYVTM